MAYDVIIGLEIHTALKTKSKMFCGCDNSLILEPNVNVCPICLGHPGTLPLPNKQAIEWTILLGLALDCAIQQTSKFDRKNYFYPDLPKGYQISQYDLPLAYKGKLRINNKTINITRLHLEEDTGKLSHPAGKDYSLVDFNRAGTPLVEMVTEPVIPDAATAKAFCQRYQQILRSLDVSGADMEKGEMRCEANISVQKKGTWKYSKGEILATSQTPLSAKVEVKNINSFRSLEKAIEFEIKRQSHLLDNKKTVSPETRGWNDTKNETVGQRVKETSADYRYFPEPDIPVLVITDTWLKTITSQLKELPAEKEERFQDEYNLSEDDARALVADKHLAGFFEAVVSELRAIVLTHKDTWERHDKTLPKLAANWLVNEFTKHLKELNLTADKTKVTAENFAELLYMINQREINSTAAQHVLMTMITQGGTARNLVEKLGLAQVDSEEILLQVIKTVIKEKSTQVTEYQKGKVTLLQFFVGQVMAKTKGSANPTKVKELLEKELKKN